MKTCTFFGHRDCLDYIYEQVEEVIIRLIKEKNVTQFYVGNQGNFDRIVAAVLQKIKKLFPQIIVITVLAYIPIKDGGLTETIVPEGIEEVPQKFALSFRNKWMVEQSDFVVAYVVNSFGGAAQFTEYARKKKKTVINIAEYK